MHFGLEPRLALFDPSQSHTDRAAGELAERVNVRRKGFTILMKRALLVVVAEPIFMRHGNK